MTFLSPWGLLGLLGILALIIIYIIKPKYQDRPVSSSFIWKLSLKYKRKKMPFEWLKSSLLLILQILIIIIMTAILTRPHRVLETLSGEKIVILDTSASMLAESQGKTRLERAIIEIEDLAQKTILNEDKFSIILAGETGEMIVNRSDSLQFIKSRLRSIESSFSISNIDEALALTESIIQANNIAEIIYYTSHDYDDTGQVRVRNMSLGEKNAAILSFKGELDQSNNYIFVTEVVSYGQSLNDVVLELRIDGQYKTSTVIDRLEAGIVSTYVWRLNDVNQDTYEQAEVALVDVVDDFVYDNSLAFYSGTQNFKILFVSHDIEDETDSNAEFIIKALRALNRNYTIRQVSSLDDADSEGYDLYIYSHNVPDTLPVDGAVWIFDPTSLPASLGSIIGDINVNHIQPVSVTQSSVYQTIMQLVTPANITISKYKQLIVNQDFDVLLNYQGDPLLMTTTNKGVKTTIFSFGMSHSNLPLLFIDLPMLIRNLSDYSLIKTIDSHVFDAGQTIDIKPHPAAVQMDVLYEDEIIASSTDIINLKLDSLGTYEITQTLNSGRVLENKFFVRVPQSESDFDYVGDVILIPLQPTNPGGDELVRDLLDLLPYLAGLLLILVAIEWGVQYREQY